MLRHYAVYKGETFLCEGTSKECAEYLGVKKETIYFLSSPANKRRAGNNGKTAIAIEEE